MGLFDRRQSRKAQNSVNKPLPFGAVNFFSQFTTSKKYSEMYFWMIAARIFKGLQNVNFGTSKETTTRSATMLQPLIQFLNRELQTLVWSLWNNGYIVIERNERGAWYIVDNSKIQIGGDRQVIGHDFVVYSEPYMYEAKTDIQAVRECLNALDVYKNADIYLTKTFGAFGILSGKEMGINAADKEELQNQLKMHAGVTESRDQFLISNSALDFHQIDFKIKDLELGNKVKEELQALAAYFCVPYDLLAVSGKSTYDNQEQAVIDFYRNCISPLAEVVLSLGRYTIMRDPKLKDVPPSALTFGIDNVAELADDRTAKVDYKLKVVDLAAKMRDLGLKIPEYITNELEDEE